MWRLLAVSTVLSTLCERGGCLSVHDGVNAPPVLVLDRNWRVQDKEAVGTVVTRVRGTDDEGDELHYGLEHYQDYSLGLPADTRPLPFTIDPDTGVVRTNQSLLERGGENLYLYVTVSDGKLTQKSAVWVTVLNSSAPMSSGSKSPFPVYPVPNSRVPPPPPLRFPNSPTVPIVVDSPKLLAPIPIPVKGGSESNGTSSTTTTTAPVKTTETRKTAAETSSTVDSTTTESSTAAPIVPNPSAVDLALTIVPLALVCLTIGLAGVTAFLFRKRLCKKYKASKMKSSEMKKKKKAGAGEDSMVMQQWTGPRAAANRYEPCAEPALAPAQPPPPPPDKPVDRWEYPRHQLKVFNILGEGCFGQVWKCQASNIEGNEGPTIVAVKTLKENAGERERSDLLQELQVMKSLEPHPNVVRLIGCCTDKDPIFVMMEYVSKGKLQSMLRNSRAQRSYDNLHGKSGSLTSRNLTSFCYQVARGMHFLSNKGIIHRDLAARNVLVAEDMTCKVADFGFARDVLASHIYERKSEGRLPIRWMAPESLYDNVFSVKSDVWSFGVLIWEVVTLGSTPYPGLSAGEVMRRVRDGYRLDKPEHCRRELYNIMYYCWDEQPTKRPDFPEISSLLEQLLLSETDYIELQHFPDHSYYNIVSLSGEKL